MYGQPDEMMEEPVEEPLEQLGPGLAGRLRQAAAPVEEDMGPMSMDDLMPPPMDGVSLYGNPVLDAAVFDERMLGADVLPGAAPADYLGGMVGGQAPIAASESPEELSLMAKDMLAARAKKRLAASENFQQQAMKLTQGQ